MNDYISREALLKRLNDFNEWCRDGRLQGSLFAADVIKDIPAAYVQPVRRGRWIPSGRDNDYNSYCRCSRCSHEIVMYRDSEKKPPNYCDNCGARMTKDGDTNG